MKNLVVWILATLFSVLSLLRPVEGSYEKHFTSVACLYGNDLEVQCPYGAGGHEGYIHLTTVTYVWVSSPTCPNAPDVAWMPASCVMTAQLDTEAAIDSTQWQIWVRFRECELKTDCWLDDVITQDLPGCGYQANMVTVNYTCLPGPPERMTCAHGPACDHNNDFALSSAIMDLGSGVATVGIWSDYSTTTSPMWDTPTPTDYDPSPEPGSSLYDPSQEWFDSQFIDYAGSGWIGPSAVTEGPCGKSCTDCDTSSIYEHCLACISGYYPVGSGCAEEYGPSTNSWNWNSGDFDDAMNWDYSPDYTYDWSLYPGISDYYGSENETYDWAQFNWTSHFESEWNTSWDYPESSDYYGIQDWLYNSSDSGWETLSSYWNGWHISTTPSNYGSEWPAGGGSLLPNWFPNGNSDWNFQDAAAWSQWVAESAANSAWSALSDVLPSDLYGRRRRDAMSRARRDVTGRARRDVTEQLSPHISYFAAHGGTGEDNFGYLVSPNYPYDYPDNLDSLCHVQTYETAKVKIEVLFFQLEDGTDCVYDHVDIRSGWFSARVCGSIEPGARKDFDTDWAQFMFHTDVGTTARGFLIKYWGDYGSFDFAPVAVMCGPKAAVEGYLTQYNPLTLLQQYVDWDQSNIDQNDQSNWSNATSTVQFGDISQVIVIIASVVGVGGFIMLLVIVAIVAYCCSRRGAQQGAQAGHIVAPPQVVVDPAVRAGMAPPPAANTYQGLMARSEMPPSYDDCNPGGLSQQHKPVTKLSSSVYDEIGECHYDNRAPRGDAPDLPSPRGGSGATAPNYEGAYQGQMTPLDGSGLARVHGGVSNPNYVSDSPATTAAYYMVPIEGDATRNTPRVVLR